MLRHHYQVARQLSTRTRCHSWLLLAMLTVLLTITPVAVFGQSEPPPSSQEVIGFDLTLLDTDGLVGPTTGKRAVDYEYCIPDNADTKAEVAAIDATARIMVGSRGRVGCVQGQVLVLGTTHQPDFLEVLRRLADLSYVQRIEQAYFE